MATGGQISQFRLACRIRDHLSRQRQRILPAWLVIPTPDPGTIARVSAADFNGDGIPDLAIIYGDGDDYTFVVMLGDGKGVFVHSPKLGFMRDPNSHCPA